MADILQQLLLFPAFSLFGLAVAVLILAKDIRKHERPSSSIAWLASIVAFPLLAAPAYLLFANRKLKRIESRLSGKPIQTSKPDQKVTEISDVLETYGVRAKTDGNNVEFIDDGVAAYEKLCGLIDKAEHSIHLMTFIFATDDVGKAVAKKLCKRAQDGLDVRVQVDAIGSWKARIFLLRRMRRSGVKIAVFLPAFPFWRKSSANLRNHRKIAIFDEKIAFAGGMNIGEEYFGPKQNNERWIDTSALFRGPAVGHLHEVFIRDWAFTTEEKIVVASNNNPRAVSGASTLQIVPGGPDLEGDPLYDVVLSGFHRAKDRIWICTPYFVPDIGLMRVLEMQARSGLDVRIYVPNKSDNIPADFVRNKMFRRLADAGAVLAAHPDKMVHAKHILIDSDISITGSANLDVRSLYINFEIAIFAYDNTSIAISEDWFAKLEESFDTSPIPAASRLRSLGEDLSWLLSPLL